MDVASRLRHDKPAWRVVKQARWLLLRKPGKPARQVQPIHLRDLFNANRTLMTVYLMKAHLKMRWTAGEACCVGPEHTAHPSKRTAEILAMKSALGRFRFSIVIGRTIIPLALPTIACDMTTEFSSASGGKHRSGR
nr:hypothetical protein [Pseudomonas aeruginosa]